MIRITTITHPSAHFCCLIECLPSSLAQVDTSFRSLMEEVQISPLCIGLAKVSVVLVCVASLCILVVA